MQVNTIITGKPIKIFSENNQFILIKDNFKLSLSKLNGNVNELKDYQPKITPYPCYGIVGCIEAKIQKYMIYIDEVEKIGEFLGADVYRIKLFKYIPYETENISPEDFNYIQMINDFLQRNPLFYSDKIDLSMSFQFMRKRKEEKFSMDSTIFRFSNHIYCWNSYLASPYNRNFEDNAENRNEGIQHFIFPIINGFFGTCSGNEYDPNLELILIARKDIRRSGMRFLIRGADNKGNVANCVEVEEILIQKNENIIINSFVQIRGSIPLLWTQEPTLKLNPKIEVNKDFKENYNVFSYHIMELIDRYDSVHCINLIDKKKDQQIIGKEYEKLVDEFKSKESKSGKNLDFSWFDFHSECKKMQYNNIKKLFIEESVSKNLEECKYNIVKINKGKFDSEIIKQKDARIEEIIFGEDDLLDYIQKQKLVFRTNCIDSLDRTNVVQSVFGRYFLLLILKDLKLSEVSPKKDDITISFKEGFETKFKNIWADNGDHVSLAYSGTGAMKSDFVRTGKRSLLGALNDGILTTRRLFINNFRDGYNQDCHDYFLGILNPKKEQIKTHSLTPINVVFIIAAVIGFQLMRMITPSGYSFLKCIIKLPLFLLFTILIAFLIINPSKKHFIDLHTNHSKK